MGAGHPHIFLLAAFTVNDVDCVFCLTVEVLQIYRSSIFVGDVFVFNSHFTTVAVFPEASSMWTGFQFHAVVEGACEIT